MLGNRFEKFDPSKEGKTRFEQMLDLFMQLLSYTNGDAGEALRWMNELDKKYQLTDDQYGMGDFIDELKEKGFLTEENEKGSLEKGKFADFIILDQDLMKIEQSKIPATNVLGTFCAGIEVYRSNL